LPKLFSQVVQGNVGYCFALVVRYVELP
jgi:hypothetical protein